MRRYIALLLTSFVAFNCLADSRTVSDAQAIASAFGESISPKTRAANFSEPTLAYTSKSDTDNLFYVFNYGEAAYVVIAADERASAILAYSDNGSFSEDNLPDGARWLLDSYKQTLGKLAMMPDFTATTKTTTRATNAIEPLLGNINFNQDYPYNMLCPSDANGQCVTGCTATALATILYYHKSNAAMTGTEEYYCSSVGDTLSFNYEANQFEWDNILPYYTGNETEEQKKAVANLMLGCGIGLKADYGSGMTGASHHYVLPLVTKHMGFDKGIAIKSHDYFSGSQWNDIIDNELIEKRPVMYVGFTIYNEGHAFVLDGKDANGLYHINWGWGGNSNGYYSLDPVSGLEPSSQGAGGGEGGFGQGQWIITGIQPDKGNPAKADMLAFNFYYDESKKKVCFSCENVGLKNFTGELGLGVFDEDNNLIDVKSAYSYAKDQLPYFYYSTANVDIKYLQYDLAYFCPVMRNSKLEEFKPIPTPRAGVQGVCVAKNEDGEYDFWSDLSQFSYLKLENFELIGKAYDKSPAEFSVTLTNTHPTEEISGYYSVYLQNGRTNKTQMFGTFIEVPIQPGETRTFIIDTVDGLNIGNGTSVATLVFFDQANYLYSFEEDDEEKSPGEIEFYVNKAVTGTPDLYITSLSLVNNASREVHVGEPFTLRMKVDNKGSYGKVETLVFVFPGQGGQSIEYQCGKRHSYYQGDNVYEFQMILTSEEPNNEYVIAPAYFDSAKNSFEYFKTSGSAKYYVTVKLLPARETSIEEISDDNKNASIYSINGSVVSGKISDLPAGIYIIKEGNTEHKVFKK